MPKEKKSKRVEEKEKTETEARYKETLMLHEPLHNEVIKTWKRKNMDKKL